MKYTAVRMMVVLILLSITCFVVSGMNHPPGMNVWKPSGIMWLDRLKLCSFILYFVSIPFSIMSVGEVFRQAINEGRVR